MLKSIQDVFNNIYVKALYLTIFIVILFVSAIILIISFPILTLWVALFFGILVLYTIILDLIK